MTAPVAVGWVWTYWLLASVVLGGACVQVFTGFVPGSGWRGFLFWLGCAVVTVSYLGPFVLRFAYGAPAGLVRWSTVLLCLSLAGAVVVFQPGFDSDGQTEGPKTPPGKGTL